MTKVMYEVSVFVIRNMCPARPYPPRPKSPSFYVVVKFGDKYIYETSHAVFPTPDL
jgi:hypothetical protein